MRASVYAISAPTVKLPHERQTPGQSTVQFEQEGCEQEQWQRVAMFCV